MTPFAESLLAYQRGDHDAHFVITRDDGFSARVPLAHFFAGEPFEDLERVALEACRGNVLDVGACAGRHSLALIARGHAVTSLDVEPACGELLHARGLPEVVVGDVMSWAGPRFATVLMLMNGIGITGTPAGLDRFLARLPALLAPGGALLCDSVDVGLSESPTHVAYREANARAGRAAGQQTFCISFRGLAGPSFPWLHLSPAELTSHAERAGLRVEIILRTEEGQYLARVAP